jgi:outer membrane lipoprotein
MMTRFIIPIPGGGITITTIAAGTTEIQPMTDQEEDMKKGFAMLAWSLCCTMLLGLCACAGGISKQTRSQITYFGPFDTVQQHPEKYRGETVMWGGRIIETLPGPKSTELVVLQLELSRQDRPQDNDQSQGRYLVRSDRFLDPAVYSQGALITVVGSVKGVESRAVGQMAYRYPVMDVIEIKKWQPGKDDSPRFHFGIGIGTHF